MPLEQQVRWVIECEWCSEEHVGCRDEEREDLIDDIGGEDAWLIIPRGDGTNLSYCPECKKSAALEYLQKRKLSPPPDAVREALEEATDARAD